MPDPIAQLQEAIADRYRLAYQVGEGGMAKVYLARDLRHDRDVAVKVLRPELAPTIGAERFLREIRLTAKLQHPHILPLLDSGEGAGQLFYVMPYVDGESLRQRLERERQLPLEEALRLATECGEALEYAHRQGVLHRDIKPENILLTQGHALVADFGIGLAVRSAKEGRLTGSGFSIGTPVYMSPEQAMAEGDLDSRSDQYSLACVLYEMLAGEPPYLGLTAEAIIAKRVKEPVPHLSTVRDVPPTVELAVRKGLARSRADRFRTVADFIQALRQPATELSIQPARRRHRPLLLALIPAIAAAALLGGRYLWGSRQPPRADPAVRLRQLTFSTDVEEYPALSPDGRNLIFSRDVGGVRQLFLINVADGSESRLTRDSMDNIQAAWTPDAKAVLFVRSRRPHSRLQPGDVFGEFQGGDIWRRELVTGAELRLVENGANPAVASDGRLAFDAERGGTHRIWVADPVGRNAEQITTDSSEAVAHVAPKWSPDGRHLVYQHIERTRFNIRTVDVATHVSRVLTDDRYTNVMPGWDPSGWAIWFSSNRTGGINLWRLPVTADGEPAGQATQKTTGAGEDVQLSVPATGMGMAFTVLRLNADLWRLPVSPASGRPTGKPEPLVVTTREDSRGVFSPDGRYIAFNSDRGGDMNVWIHSMEDGIDRQLTRGPGGDYQPRWSPNGNRIVFFSARSGNADIWEADVATGALTQLTSSPWLDINPSYSPNGTRIAFHSDRGGRLEVWLMNADGSEQRQLTPNGAGIGHFLAWSPDGKYIYFRNGDSDGTPSRIPVTGGQPEPLPIRGGSHMSFGPGARLMSDVINHRQLWVSPLDRGEPYPTFAFDDPEVRVDYPMWSPDGRWILFDRSKPEGGDIWLMRQEH